jgi:hypothetical protein
MVECINDSLILTLSKNNFELHTSGDRIAKYSAYAKDWKPEEPWLYF